jgi:site-specific DNA recombinase
MIPVPALVPVATWEAVQAQLAENRRARPQHRPSRYLLTGLICCARCGYACVGQRTWNRRYPQPYRYYRCQGTDARRFGGEPPCTLHPVPMDPVDAAVWQEVCAFLAAPAQMLAEYERRLAGPVDPEQQEQASLVTQRAHLQRGRSRLIDSYAEEIISKEDFLPRLARFDARLAATTEHLAALQTQQEEEQALRLVISRFEDFAQAVATGLADADLERKRAILHALVKRVEIDDDLIRVVFRVSPPRPPDHDPHSLHDWEHRATALGEREEVSGGAPGKPQATTLRAKRNAGYCAGESPSQT